MENPSLHSKSSSISQQDGHMPSFEESRQQSPGCDESPKTPWQRGQPLTQEEIKERMETYSDTSSDESRSPSPFKDIIIDQSQDVPPGQLRRDFIGEEVDPDDMRGRSPQRSIKTSVGNTANAANAADTANTANTAANQPRHRHHVSIDFDPLAGPPAVRASASRPRPHSRSKSELRDFVSYEIEGEPYPFGECDEEGVIDVTRIDEDMIMLLYMESGRARMNKYTRVVE